MFLQLDVIMRRRNFIRKIGTIGVLGMAGCNDYDNSDTTDTLASPSPSTSNAKLASSEIQRRVLLKHQDAVDDQYDMRIQVELLREVITDKYTAKLRITVKNEGPKRAFSIGTEMCDLFNRSKGGSDNPKGLWLYSAGDTDHIDRKETKWTSDLPPDKLPGYSAYGCLPRVYGAGESLSNEYEVWDDYRIEGYLEPDRYRWREKVRIWENPDPELGATPTNTVTWGFSLQLK